MRTSSILALIAVTLAIASFSIAGVPPVLVNYQGKIFDIDGNPIEGTVDIGLNLYTNDILSEVVYTEDIGSVEVVGGVYNFDYGRGESAFLQALNHDEVWMEVVIDDEPMVPKQRLLSVPYALCARKTTEAPDGLLILEASGNGTYVNTTWGQGPTWYGVYIPEGTTELRAKMQAKFVQGGEYRLCCHGVVGPTYSTEATPTSPYPWTQEMTVPVTTSGWINISVQVRNYAVPGGANIYKLRVYTKAD